MPSNLFTSFSSVFLNSPPGHREEPYLTEAGRDAFDRFCRLCHGELQALSGGLLQTPRPVLVEESELVKDSLNVLLGVVSATFSLCQVRRVRGYLRPALCGTASPGTLSWRCSAMSAGEGCSVGLIKEPQVRLGRPIGVRILAKNVRGPGLNPQY